MNYFSPQPGQEPFVGGDVNLSSPHFWQSWWFIGGLIGVLIFIVLLFLFREFWCWYFKINKIEKLLEKIEENTRQKD